MNSTIENLVRGSGKIFALLRLTDVPAGCVPRAASLTDAGRAVPALLAPFDDGAADDGRFVAVVAQLACDQTLTISAVDAAGVVRAETAIPINPAAAKWRSRLNYRVSPAIAAQIRDYDRAQASTPVAFAFDKIIDDFDVDLVRVRLTLPPDVAGPVALHLLDRKGRPLEEAATALSDGIVVSPDRPELRHRRIAYSLRLRRRDEPFIACACACAGRMLSGFVVVGPEEREELRRRGRYITESACFDPAYDRWFREHRITEDELAMQRATRFDVEPTFSIVVPLYRTPLPYFYEMVASVLAQSYRRWELILVNGSPEDEALGAAVREVADLCDQIRVIPLSENLGIAGNTNAGLEAAAGDYVALFDHDDVIEPDLLFEYARAINADPSIDVLYCDEDKLNPEGVYIDAYFKPDFEIDLLRASNYVCHMLCLRRTLREACGPLDPALDGAQDHDLILRAAERTDRIHHVARMLYHWRVSATSTAATIEAKPYAAASGVRAIEAHLARLGLDATVRVRDYAQVYDVNFAVPEPHPLVSIIIPSCDHADLLERCLRSIREKTAYDAYEVVIVENNSADAATFAFYDEAVAADRRVRVATWPGEFNYAKIINFGARQARGEYLLLLNNDIEVITPDWIERLLGMAARTDVGAVGAKLYYPDDTIQHAGVVMLPWHGPEHFFVGMPRDHGGLFWLNRLPQDVSAVTGACLMTKRSTFEAVGGFDEAFAVDFNDVDFCLRLREAGLLVVYNPDAELYHRESITRGLNDTPEKAERYAREQGLLRQRWPRYFSAGDPAYNVNLSGAYYHLKW